jgi:CelD/BcsL family acetyltransferase involved in cellulose biosynthesis
MIESSKPSSAKVAAIRRKETKVRLTCAEYGEDDLALLKKDWSDLFEASLNPSIFSSWEWTSLWWKHFRGSLPEGQGDLIILGAHQHGRLIGIAPFIYPKNFLYGMKRLRPVGDLGANEGMTDEWPLLLKQGDENAALRVFKEYLAGSAASSRWDCAFLRWIDRDRDSEPPTKTSASRETLTAILRVAQLNDTWDEYRSTLSRSMRTNLTYYPRKLEKHGHIWRFEVAKSPVDVAVIAPDLIRLHRGRSSSQRGIAHTNHIPDEIHETFLTEMLVKLSSEGRAWIGAIRVNGSVIAAQAFFETNATITFYYSGFDARFYDYSPLLILAAEVIRHGFKDGIRQINFLPDVVDSMGSPTTCSDWKTRWRAIHAGRCTEIMIYPSNPRASLIKHIRSLRASFQGLSKVGAHSRAAITESKP